LTRTRSTHESLLNIALQVPKSGRVSVHALFGAINSDARSALNQAQEKFRDLSAQRVRYFFDFDPADGPRFTERLALSKLPLTNELRHLLQWSCDAMAFDASKQRRLREYVALFQEHANVSDEYSSWREERPTADISLDYENRLMQLRQAKDRCSSELVGIRGDFQHSWIESAYGPLYSWPFISAIAGDSDRAELYRHAECYESLGKSLDYTWLFQQKRNQRLPASVQQMWWDLADAGNTLVLLAHWIRAISYPKDREYCDLCYRSRSTKVRCRAHRTSGGLTPEVRLARHVHPIFETLLTSSERRFTADFQDLHFGTTARSSDLPAKLRATLDKEFHVPAALLVTQVDRLARFAGPELGGEWRILLDRVVSAAVQSHAQPCQSGPRGAHEQSTRRRNVLDALQLRSLASAWFGGLDTLSIDVPRDGLQMPPTDVDNPVVLGSAVDTQALARDLMRHRAWFEALSGSKPRVRIPLAKILVLRKQGWSLARIAKEVGATKEGVRKALLSGSNIS